MRVTRRWVCGLGGGFLAAQTLPRTMATAAEAIDIAMTGTRDGSRVWFDPIGVHVRIGQTVRWTNRDVANSHTATAYHPANFDRPRRIPVEAQPWDSDYLLPEESFSLTLTVPGVYDYYCIPHEMAGMVGRIVVGMPPPGAAGSSSAEGLPDAALNAFPPVEDIVMKGIVRRN